MKYLRKFNTHSEYAEEEKELIVPNVSYCDSEEDIHFNSFDSRLVIIKYISSDGSDGPIIGFADNIERLWFNGQELINTEFGWFDNLENPTIVLEYAGIGSHVDTTTLHFIATEEFEIKAALKDNTTFSDTEGATIGANYGKSISIPKTIERITTPFGENLFTEVNIPDSVKLIGYRAFGNRNNLKKVVIGAGIETIEYEAFSGVEEAEITIKALTPPSLVMPDGTPCNYSEVFLRYNYIYVPASSVDAYKTAWSEGAEFIRPIA